MLSLLLVRRKRKKKKERHGQGSFSQGQTYLADCARWDFCGC
jgi:hypothetical protein